MDNSATHQARPLFDLMTFLSSEDHETRAPVAIVGAGLLIAVCIIHLQDQGGLLGGESPTWMKWGYYLVELASLVAAAMVLRKRTFGWLLGIGTTALPFIGYLLTRSVGLPGDAGDIGNWSYTLGTVSLIVEALFVLVASVCLLRIYREGRERAARAVSPSSAPSFAGQR
jgi:hypothetical protein